jgi:hypothetical protein
MKLGLLVSKVKQMTDALILAGVYKPEVKFKSAIGEE